MSAPSPWVTENAHHIAPGGSVLNLACGAGRHTRWLVDQGFRVMGVDINIENMGDLMAHENVAVLEADLENGHWPLGCGSFDAIIVTNYLHRPLFPHIMGALAENGVLIYETFMAGNEDYGRPANPDFLLQPDELQDLCKRLDIVAYEQGYEDDPKPAMRQKIVAINRS